ncbi:MAG: site-2 protease family protein [Enterococcus sp.]|nr:site-2 protease family protein [Enterococcus sp.]
MQTAILIILLFLIMIFPHELGHFLVAKLCGVQVNEFAIGMGPAIFKRQKGETLYALRLIPFGGYCAMEGENEESDNPRAFNNKKWWQKLLVLIAGAAMNFLTALIIMVIISVTVGITTGDINNKVASVNEGSPAYSAGIKTGDRIVGFGGNTYDEAKKVTEPVVFTSNFTKYIKETGKSTVGIWIIRDRSDATSNNNSNTDKDSDSSKKGPICIKVTPDYDKSSDKYLLGLAWGQSVTKLHGIGDGIRATGNLFTEVVDTFKMLLSGEAGINDMSGPVGIGKVVDQTKESGLSYFFYLAAFISVNIGIFNVLPFPALDGGRVLFVFIRRITGKMISDNLEGKIHAIGFILLIALMLYISYNDIIKLF